jgi:hypothetical protein
VAACGLYSDDRYNFSPWRTLCDCDWRVNVGARESSVGEGFDLSYVAFQDERTELCRITNVKKVIREKAVFVLNAESSQFSIWRVAEDDVAGVVGVFEEGGVGVLAAEAGCFSDLRLCC